MAFKEITHCIQRFEMMEKRAGIEIKGLMATVDDEADDGEISVSLMAEIISTGTGDLSNDIEVDINCYNANGQLCGSTTHYIYTDEFPGIDTLNEVVYCKDFPTQIKLIPKVKN